MARTRDVISKLTSLMAIQEKYRGSKNPKAPQVGIGDIREITKNLAQQLYEDPEALAHMVLYGKQISVDRKISKKKK